MVVGIIVSQTSVLINSLETTNWGSYVCNFKTKRQKAFVYEYSYEP